ncbi:SDR family NAD(P)-dependent oxidoreductase [Pseudaminobacter soli (ex Li et al. 2025)]|uniref:NADP-dependent 3-hydroxy acid dehydrogenase YdfG n=1 Tax=Pseudaminobacter soli (ex Li et al. 2025) TaxID=1295366 RepID=A0A2P7SJY4_9HYPH|nr:SDR family oxidoreductase [Mesorhizobium soli]PSJ62797.1 SDR family oxidoreductase [Mesorhizobium soli]
MSDTMGTAVVTGASSGIGAIYADRLAERGYDLVLVARSAGKLAQVAGRIRAKTGRQVDVMPADLADAQDLAQVEAFLKETPDVTLLVNNAGLGGALKLLDSDVDQMTSLIALNVTALTRLTYAIVPQFVARGTGTIINIASVVAINPESLNGVYGGSKAFVLAFSQNLRHELAGTGVTVQVVLPGATATDFWAIAGRPVEQLPSAIVMRSEDLVDAALVGLDRGEFATIPSLQDGELFAAYEAARQAMIGKLSTSTPAPRYRNAA